MRLARRHFTAGEIIPAESFLKERKLVKYFSRETAAAVTAMGELLAGGTVPAGTPAYYGIGIVEKESFGLETIAAASTGADGRFSQKLFAEEGFVSVPPLNQFKVLYNMPLCFVSIVFGLTGDNAVIYSSGKALLEQALLAPSFPVLLGAGKSYADGSVAAAFALAASGEIEAMLAGAAGNNEAIDLLTGAPHG
jgi:hypothetical protein